jgi:hypothetical protein
MLVFGGRNEFTVFSDLHMFDPGKRSKMSDSQRKSVAQLN